MIYFAKSDQTYREHLEAVYVAWKETIAAKKPLIERLAKKYGFSVERFIQGSLLTIAFHDTGKMIEPFQEMIQADRGEKVYNKKNNYRHELVSFIYTVQCWHIINKTQCLSTTPVEALAVAGHHKPLNADLTSFQRESSSPMPQIIPDGIREALLIAEEFFTNEGFLLPRLDVTNVIEDPYKSLDRLLWHAMPKLIEKDGINKVRTLYFLLKGILHYSDWHGSGKASVRYSIKRDDDTIINQLENRCRAKGLTFTGLRPFQKNCREHSGHLIAIAPTGSGKTEASLLWAIKNAKEMHGAKILYLLPTMVTANEIWKRLTDVFGEENVGLTHSTASLFLQNNAGESEEDLWENRKDVLFSQSFIKPVTVGTIDQLLMAGFNSGRWVLKEINASNSVIIIDEIHAYDGWTLGLILKTIHHFSSLGAQFMLMSATLPESLLRLLKKNLSDARILKDETFLEYTRSQYFVEDHFLEDNLKDIENAVSCGMKVLVVVNTVASCQNLFQKLSHLKPVCYHSLFTMQDRKRIEEGIKDCQFVIATQVVEVSLDIDYDWLFTECAPPDALVQRAGRVNRYRDARKDSRVYIFKSSEKAAKIYNPVNDPYLLNRSFEAFKEVVKGTSRLLTESDLNELVELVYKDYKIDDTDSFKDALMQYDMAQKKRNAIYDSRLNEEKDEVTRQAKYETLSVIPICFKDDVLKMKPVERRWYEIKLPLWYVLRNKEEEKGIIFCNVEYDSSLGAQLLRVDEVASVFI